MAEYYGVERTPEYLAHYGIRGMKWGVRRAKEIGGKRGAKRLAKQFAKAQKKLNKLDIKANTKEQTKRAEQFDKSSKFYRKAGRAGLGMLGVGLGTGFGSMAWVDKKHKPINEAINKAVFNGGSLNDIAYLNGAYDSYTKTQSKIMNRFAKPLAAAGAGTALGAYGGAALHKAIADKARKRTTAEGHKQAVAERNAWQQEMNKAFAGTKYASKPRHRKKRK